MIQSLKLEEKHWLLYVSSTQYMCIQYIKVKEDWLRLIPL